ncbi:hypothetical protein [Spiroplasma endosymbiont of Polydrusus formosus]|uniref:hypothetical protein n=1 Tax=Spiroplasma endosymbiont of Polydrusus formosus TaxID=3139326 RepID=UPI0035B51C1B
MTINFVVMVFMAFHIVRYITKRLVEVYQKPATVLNAIICNLGNGSSICVVKNGQSFNTSMGLTFFIRTNYRKAKWWYSSLDSSNYC